MKHNLDSYIKKVYGKVPKSNLKDFKNNLMIHFGYAGIPYELQEWAQKREERQNGLMRKFNFENQELPF